MQNVLRIVLCLALPLTALGQNVGIGTTTPQARLHVAGTGRFDAGLAVNPTPYAAANAIAISASTSAVNITAVGGVQTNAVTYTATPAEGQMLYIFNADADAATFAGSNIATNTAQQFVYLAGAWRSLGGSATPGWLLTGNTITGPTTDFIGTLNAQPFAVRTSNTERLRVTSIGNVGIGTTAPVAALHVPIRVPTAYTGQVAVSQGTRAVDVQGRYAYTCGGWGSTGNFQVLDISNPTAPIVKATVSLPVLAYSIKVKGRYAYLGMNNTFRVYDISNPMAPVLMGSCATGQGGNALIIQGRYAFLTQNNNPDYWNTIDISNPAAPTVVDAFNPGTNLSGLDVQGRFAYTSSGTRFMIYDIQNPVSPMPFDSIVFPGGSSFFNDVDVEGRYAYFLQGNSNQLLVYDVSSPGTTPVLVSTTAVPGIPQKVVVQGDYVYIVTAPWSTPTLYLYNVSNPAAPVLEGSFASVGLGSDFVIQGRYGYFTASSGGDQLRIADFAGTQLANVEVGSMEVSYLAVRKHFEVANSAEIADGLNVGRSLHVNGNASINGNLCYTGTIGTCSDARFKQNIRPIPDALARVASLNPVAYDWRTDQFPDRHFAPGPQIGFIAQELEQLFPELVTEDAEGYKHVNYGQLTPVLVAAIQQLKQRIEALETENAALHANTARVATLEAQLASLTRQVEQLVSLTAALSAAGE
jgi:hypothetical protein